ncbi:MAG: permease, partial [Clostridia bacterium]|nr:permease [Clostridia bacterium]
VAYPFGMVGVVLFVQLIPKWLKADMPKERKLFQATVPSPRQEKTGLFACDPLGMAPFAFAVVLGLLLGLLRIPLTAKGYAGPCFSLGATGGTLLMSLLFGHFGHVGNLSLKVPTGTTKVLRELGLMLFLIGAGVSGGVSLVSEVGNAELGVMLVVYGVLVGVMITMLPLFLAFWVAKRVLKLNLLENLGSIAGGMTSTPALGTLIQTAGTDAIAAAYASTYPLALVFIVLSFQLMVTLMV